MASGLSTAYLNAALNQLFGGGDHTRLGSVYLALMTTAHTSASGGGTEVSTGNWTDYQRLTLDNDGAGTIWSSASSGNKTTNTELAWASATISGGAPTINGWAIYDASTSGNLLAFGPLSTPRTVNNGAVFKFQAGDLDINATNEGAG